MAEISINNSVCINCGACVEICSVTHVYSNGQGVVEATSPQRCWRCGHCVAVCPVDAIRHSEFDLDECPVLMKDEDGFSHLMDVFQTRNSIRVYSEKLVDRRTISDLIDSVRWAPSGGNRRTVRWLGIDDRNKIDLLEDKVIQVLDQYAQSILDSMDLIEDRVRRKREMFKVKLFTQLRKRLVSGEHPVFFRAPLILLAVTPDSELGRDDAVISGYSMQLAAPQMGLASCQIGYFILAQSFAPGIFKDFLEIPDGEQVQMVLTIGHPKYTMRRSINRTPLPLEWV